MKCWFTVMAIPPLLHRKGLEAENRITAARESLANLLDCDPAQITFTSGGTEANNLALLGVAEAGSRKGKRIVTTAFEHSSVDAAAGRLEQLGWEVVRVKPDVAGHIDAKKVVAAVDSSTVLVSCMCVNNEVGTILPIGQIVKGIRRRNPGTLIHCDCVQALGKMPLSMRRMDLDLATVSAHKIYGPKGSGALYVRRGVRVLPRQLGGSQEKKLRPGTEAAALIVGFGTAAALAREHLEADARRIADLNQELRCRAARHAAGGNQLPGRCAAGGAQHQRAGLPLGDDDALFGGTGHFGVQRIGLFQRGEKPCAVRHGPGSGAY